MNTSVEFGENKMEDFNDVMVDMSCTCGMKLRKPPKVVILMMALTVIVKTEYEKA